jgi:NAD(P) transhydrogenase subunit beta
VQDDEPLVGLGHPRRFRRRRRVAFVIRANDVMNPAAMTVLLTKRGMGSGYAGVENELFFRDNAMLLFGDARKMTESIVRSLAH